MKLKLMLCCGLLLFGSKQLVSQSINCPENEFLLNVETPPAPLNGLTWLEKKINEITLSNQDVKRSFYLVAFAGIDLDSNVSYLEFTKCDDHPNCANYLKDKRLKKKLTKSLTETKWVPGQDQGRLVCASCWLRFKVEKGKFTLLD